MEAGVQMGGNDAVSHIHAELNRLKRQRILALVVLLLVSGITLAYFGVSGAGEESLNRSAGWSAAMALFFTAAAASASLTLGLPLYQRAGTVAVTFGASVAVVAGLALAMDIRAPIHTELTMGMPCFGSGTVVSIIAFFVTALLTGRLWRRMTDIAWIGAVGASAIGLGVLNARCGHNDPVHLFGFHLPIVIAVFLFARMILAGRKSV